MPVESFLGIHTCVPNFIKLPNLHFNTILRNSGGLLPPYIICCGDRRRVKRISTYLDKHSLTDLSELMVENGHDPERVSIVVGTYKGTPVAIFEHQMGCAACERLSREVLHPETSMRNFTIPDGTIFAADSKYIIRVGSCGAVNGLKTKEKENVELWDVVVANSVVGVDGTTTQSITGNMNAAGLSQKDQDNVRTKLKKLGYAVDRDMPVAYIDKMLASRLQAEITKLLGNSGIRAPLHAAVSKDSLYAETIEEDFMRLRDEYDVACTEMELSVINYIAREFSRDGEPIKVGMACVSLGVIPGMSFCPVDKVKRAQASEAAARGALETLHFISQDHKIVEKRGLPELMISG